MSTERRNRIMRSMLPFGLLSLIGLAGCFSLSRTETPQRTYVLGGGEPAVAAVNSSTLSGLTVGLRRIELADYLATPFIVVRRGSNVIGYSEYDRWAEELAGGVSRAVARNLSARDEFRAVDVAPWPARSTHDHLIQLHLLRFEGMAPENPQAASGEAHMLVNWEILQQLDGTVLDRGTTDYRVDWSVDDYASLVALLDAGLDSLSNDLVRSMESLATSRAEAVLSTTGNQP
jgi:uncharacterized lipoprotein YmbA